MQKFHLTLVLVFSISSAIILYILTNISPYTDNNTSSVASVKTGLVMLVLFLLVLAVASLFSLVTYPIRVFLSPYIDRRFHVRKGLKQGGWLGAAVASIILLSVTNTFNPITAGITLALLLVLEIWFT